MLASKSAYPAPMGGAGYSAPYQHSPTYRVPTLTATTNQGVFTSPTESEFSETYDTENSIRYVMQSLFQEGCSLTFLGVGMKPGWANGSKASIAHNTWSSFEVRWHRHAHTALCLLIIENHINGENLMDMDQTTLRDMGVKKIGDRVRIGSQAKQMRNSTYRRTSKRNVNRVSVQYRQGASNAD